MNPGDFKKEYRKLNDRQRRAVDAIDGPVMVIAGPGTGKTQVLTLRIANILAKTDAEPRSVLALTFTEKASYNMRERLRQLIGQTAYEVRIGTFHSFSNEVIARSPDSFPEMNSGTPLEDSEQLSMIEATLESADIDLLRPAGRPELYVRAIISAIGDSKGKGFSPLQLKDAIPKSNSSGETDEREKRKIQRMEELARIYERYEAELTRSHRYDYADMLRYVVQALEVDRGLRLDLAEQYQYVLVDEHQDTNRLQNRIVQLLTEHGDAPNVFVVGDLEQAIYRFQGASPENFRDFAKRYTETKIIRLSDNYRSGQAILDAALGISPGQGKLRSSNPKHRASIERYSFSSPSVMEYGVASLVADAIKAGTIPSQIAVLYRKNREADGLMSALEQMGISSAVQSDQEVLDDIHIRKVLTIAYAARDIGHDAPLLRALQIDLLGVSPLDAARIGAYARAQKIRVWDLIRTTKASVRIPFEDANAVDRAYALLKDASGKMNNMGAGPALQHIVEAVAWIPYAASLPRGHETIGKLRALFDAVRAFSVARRRTRLGDFLQSLERLERHNTDLSSLARAPEHAVQLMTVHKAKGLEFDFVIIANTVRGHWDDARKPAGLSVPDALRDDDPAAEDEDVRRLFYVAVTRARKRIAMVWPQRSADGKSLEPSRFVLAIPERLTAVGDTDGIEKRYTAHAQQALSVRRREPTLRQKEFIGELLDRQPLSVTALNNYVRCPWNYYFSNLVRIPEAATPKSAYGTAAHEALRKYFDHRAKGKKQTATDLLTLFRVAMKKAPLEEHVIQQLTERGRAALNGWHRQWKSSWPAETFTEVSIDRVELASDVSLTGKLDKIERLQDGSVTVVDYKTKEPMSLNAIKGLTKSGTGNEWRQLLFYKILLDEHDRASQRTAKKWRMSSGEIDFLESNASGTYKKERVAITSDMTKDLRENIMQTVRAIRSLSFWNSRCADTRCRYCRLAEMMSP